MNLFPFSLINFLSLLEPIGSFISLPNPLTALFPPFLFLAEVQIKVQVFDNSDLSPLAGAQVEVHGNQTVLASSRAGGDGVLRVSFLYRTGTWVVITASKQDYVTNSVPWHSSRIPCESRMILMTLSASEVLHQHSLRIIMLDIKCLTVSECHTSKLGLL